MKNNFFKNSLIIFSSIFFMACGNETQETNEVSFDIQANLTGLAYQKAYFSEYKNGEMFLLDSAEIKDGKFNFKGRLTFPEVRYISFKDGEEKFSVFVENSNITITGSLASLESIKIEGSSIQKMMDEFLLGLKTHENNLNLIADQYYAAEKNADEEGMKTADHEYDAADLVKTNYIQQFVNSNSTSVIAPYLSLKHVIRTLGVKEIEQLVATFKEDAAKSIYTTLINDRVAILKNSQIGSLAPEFTMNDAQGNPISLSSFRGKYLLIDFWAAWCGPCRAENPNVVAAYKKYNKKGFDVFGVSLDENHDKWLEAIKKDGLTWTQVSDLKGWANAAAKLYGVNSIPHSVLLDKEGIIIAKDLRGEELLKKLEEVLK